MGAFFGNRTLLVNYLLLLSLGVIWGSQFLLNKLAIVDFLPSLVAGGRIVIGAMTLTVLVWLLRPRGEAGGNAPPRASLRLWGHFFLIGGLEATVPFFLIAWGQQHIHSGIAAILLGTVPLLTLLLSTIFVPGERFGVGSVLAVLLGLAAVTVLVGPSAFTGVLSDIYGELAVLGASLSFAIAYVMLSRLPPFPLLYKARNMLICAAVQITVAVLILDHDWSGQWSLSSVLAILILGIVCSGLVFIPFVALIHRAGPTFTSLNNSLIPPVGVVLGFVFLGERFTVEEAIAIVLVLLALVAISLPKLGARRLASRRNQRRPTEGALGLGGGCLRRRSLLMPLRCGGKVITTRPGWSRLGIVVPQAAYDRRFTMDIGENTRGRPEYSQLSGLYGQLGFGPKAQRTFGASFKVFALRAPGDAWLDAHIGYLKATMMLQFAAMALTIVGLLLMVAGGLDDLVFVAIFFVAALLGIWSLLRTRKGSTAFANGERP